MENMIIRKVNNGMLELHDETSNIIMTIEEKIENGTMLIDVSGEIRSEVAHEFEDEIMAAFSVSNNIMINLSKATYISSLALRALLSLQQMIDDMPEAKMVICGLSPQIKQSFVESGFYDILYIEE